MKSKPTLITRMAALLYVYSIAITNLNLANLVDLFHILFVCLELSVIWRFVVHTVKCLVLCCIHFILFCCRATIARNEKTFWTNVYSDYIMDASDSSTDTKRCDPAPLVSFAYKVTSSVFVILFVVLILVVFL